MITGTARTKARWAFALAILLVGAGVLCALWDREAWAIRRQSVRLEKALNKPAGESAVRSMLRARDIVSFFSRDTEIEPGEPLPRLRGRQDLTVVVGQALVASDAIRTKVLDRDFTWQTKGQEGLMDITVEVTARVAGEPDRLLRAYKVFWVKEENRWVVRRVQINETIQRPPEVMKVEPLLP